MFRKILLAGVCALMFSAGAFAADVLAMSLNFHDDDGNITVAGDLPAGVMMKKRIRFSNKKLTGYAYPLAIEIDRAPSVDLTFKITGQGEFVVSVNPIIWEGGKEVSRMKAKTTPLAPSSMVLGKNRLWMTPVTNAVTRITASRSFQPYFSSRIGPSSRM